MGRTIHAAALAIALLAASSVITAQEWPRFRGNEAGVAADHPTLPETWSQTENVRWTRPIPGIGWSSPVVWGDHIFLSTVVNTALQEPPKPGFYLGDWPASSAPHRWMVYDIDFRTGAVRWEREVSSTPPGKAKHLKNSYASETAVTDGERVYFYFANSGLYAFDFTGKPVWSKPMGPFKTRNNWGSGASPVLHRDRIYIVNDNDEQSFLAAYDTRTGAEVWKVERKEGTNWSTPFVWENELRTEIVTSGSDRVRSYDLSGKLLWEFSGMSSISIPTPFSRFGMLYISSGYIADPKRPAMAIKPGASGDISLQPGETSNQYIVWSSPTGAPYNPTPIIYGDVYYTLFDRGFFTSQDARTGKEIYGRQRITAEASGFTSSPWAYNGKIFVLSEEGDTYVIQAGPEFKVLGKNSLGEMTLATPAIARGSLIVRTASKLYRISTAPTAPPQTTALFDGTLKDWNVEGTSATAEGGVLAVDVGNGWVRRNGVRGNFTLTMDMRLIGRDAKAGIYVRAWPTFDPKSKAPTNGYRVSLSNGLDSTSPEGISQWIRVEIVCNGRAVTVRMNGREVLARDDLMNPQGFVALSVQGGRGEFRNLELSTLPRQPSSRLPAGAVRAGSPGVQLPRQVKAAQPAYTADAMRARISGGVVVEAVVRPDGTVGDVDVAQSLDPRYGLDDAAVAAAKQWRFEPGTRDGKPAAVLVTIELYFLLK